MTNPTSQSKRIEKKINASKLRRVVLIKPHGGNLIVDQVNEHLLFISANKQYMYDTTYVCNYDGHTAIPSDGYIYEGAYVIRITESVNRITDPDRFMELLTHTPKTFRKRNCDILLDGKMVYKDVPYIRGQHLLWKIKNAQANKKHPDHELYKDSNIVTVITPAGHKTSYIIKDTPKRTVGKKV